MSPTTEPDLIVIPAEWPAAFRAMARAEAMKRAEQIRRTAGLVEEARKALARALLAEFRGHYGLDEPSLLRCLPIPLEQVEAALGEKDEPVQCSLILPGAEPIHFSFRLTGKAWVDRREIHWHQCPVSGKAHWWKVGEHLFPRHDLSGALFLSLALRQSAPSETPS